MEHPQTHSKLIGYLLWIFGFTGAHRFYFGRPITGTIWLLTLGLCGIGWLVDLFFIPWMERTAARKYTAGKIDYSVAWILQTFLGFFGIDGQTNICITCCFRKLQQTRIQFLQYTFTLGKFVARMQRG